MSRDRSWPARLRVHGQGPFQRLPHALLHDLAPAATSRAGRDRGRDPGAVIDAAARYGFERAVTDWREIVHDPRIALFDNCGPNGLHAAPTIAAAEAGST